MKTLLLIASLLAATPTSDAGKTAPKPSQVQVKTSDAGVTTSERRYKLLVIVNGFKEAIEATGSKVEIQNILFATNFTSDKDAAVVLAVIDGKLIANFFMYNEKWSVFPTDFTAVGAP